MLPYHNSLHYSYQINLSKLLFRLRYIYKHRPRHGMAHTLLNVHAKIQLSKWSGLRDISKFVISHSSLAQRASGAERKAQAEAFDLGKVWPTGQSLRVPKFSPLGGPVSEILVDVIFVPDGRTHARTHAHTHTTINSENYIDR